jgi:diguanylate cyclase (GGDEF)-like protein
MSTLLKLKFLLVAVIACFVAAAIYISVLVVERQEALEHVSRYNVAWLVSQATTEYARLEQRISEFGLPGSDVNKDEVELRFDIIVNRLNLLAIGDVEEFLQTDPEHQQVIRDLSQTIAAAQPLVQSLDTPGNVLKLLDILKPLDGKLARLAAAANRFGGDRVAHDQRQLIALHWEFSALAGGLIVCGVALIALLFWHNTLLSRAHGELRQLADGMRTQNDRFDAALNNMSQGLCMVDTDERLIVCNEPYRKLFRLSEAEVQPGTPMRELLGHIAGPTNSRDGMLAQVLAEQRTLIEERRLGTYMLELPDCGTLSISHQPIASGGWVATYEDISERRRAEARIAHMAHHDALTDLPNRVLLRERLELAYTQIRDFGTNAAILFLDLDRFKTVNDTLGHPMGDKLLDAVATRLRSCVRDTEMVARLGGDEFAILQIGVEQPQSSELLARRVLKVISDPYDLDGQHAVVGTSIGIALAPHDGVSPDELLKSADMALYRAKADGRNTHRFFEAQMDADLQRRRLLELDLRRALAAGEFELHYQPLVDLDTRNISGCEALLRWRHPERGFISPGSFIGVAEEIGLIGAIGEWVLRQACMQAARWSTPVKVAVNLSPLEFTNRNLVHTVMMALANSGLPASQLELEITESLFLRHNDNTIAILNELRGLGVRIAMDDFGTGYSSLSYLRSFPFDKIKLDQSFVRDLSNDAEGIAIVNSIAVLGKSLGMITTAEGIETAEQLDIVRKAGFVQGQGYYFWRPMPAQDFAALLPAVSASAAA